MSESRGVVGRFAPSPTGPLHLGSLVAALGSWLFARAAGGRWLVRMEDLDTPRVVPGAADEILRTLERFGLTWDGEVVFQSTRLALYERALEDLLRKRMVYACACSRADLVARRRRRRRGETTNADARCGRGARSIRAPAAAACRPAAPPALTASAFPPASSPSKIFSSVPSPKTSSRSVGDFVVKRADGPFAYQLAVVVDDAAQGVTEVVRGADLLDSTARQIALQRALGLPTPAYAHLPLVLGPDGKKLGKSDGALPLETLDEARLRAALAFALRTLGQEPRDGTPREILEEARARFSPGRIPREASSQRGAHDREPRLQE